MSPRPARRLLEPDFWTTPAGPRWRPKSALTYGPEVADICDKAGFTPDPQQQLGLDLIFAIRPDGSPLTFEFNLIVARQNLKTGLFKQAVLGWLFVTEEPAIVWSSHEMSTTREAQAELYDLISETPALSRHLPKTINRGLYEANGQERIELDTGQKINFRARRQTGGRGLGKRKLILDEAFALKPAMQGSLIPIMLAQKNPQVLYGSSAPQHDSVALRETRDRGRVGLSPRLTHLEWLAPREPCADPDCLHPKDALTRGLDCALDREHLLLAANPTVSTGRISIQTLRDARQAMPPDQYMIECLGWAPEPDEAAKGAAVDLARWDRLANPKASPPKRAAVVLDVEPDQSAASIGLAGDGPGGRTLLMVHAEQGLSWVIARLKALRSQVDVLEVALHPSGQAAVLIPRLDAEGIAYTELSSKDTSRGCGAFLTGVEESRYIHLGQPEMTGAVAIARTRYVNEVQVWDRRDIRVGITAVVSPSIAAHRWAVLTAKPKHKPAQPQPATATRETRPRVDVAHAGF